MRCEMAIKWPVHQVLQKCVVAEAGDSMRGMPQRAAGAEVEPVGKRLFRAQTCHRRQGLLSKLWWRCLGCALEMKGWSTKACWEAYRAMKMQSSWDWSMDCQWLVETMKEFYCFYQFLPNSTTWHGWGLDSAAHHELWVESCRKFWLRVIGRRLSCAELSRAKGETLHFYRGNELPKMTENKPITKQQRFSIFGELIGHYSTCSWFRVMWSFLKRVYTANSWQDSAGAKAHAPLMELLESVNIEDPVYGRWHVPPVQECLVWCDASHLALGVVLEE